jgi:uncharacterized protein (TIGR02284 family)
MRPDAALTLDELAELANDCWEAYGQAADWAGPGDLAQLFLALAGQRRAMAKTIEGVVMVLGHAPRDRDTDVGAAHRLAARLKGTFVGERPRALIQECERSDTAFAHRLITIDEAGLPTGTGPLLRGFHAEVVAALGQLAAAKLRLRSG